jgi:putative tryptophan/tyrosine transport system substrate-binding protein
MKNSKKLYLFGLSIFILLSFGLADLFAMSKTPPKVYRVVVVNYVTHPALDLIVDNMKIELSNRGYNDENIEYIIKNANGDNALVASIAFQVKTFNPDVVVGITTPVAQAIAKAWKGPFVFSAVTDPVGAQIMPDWEKGNGVVTGVSDMWPYGEQIKLMRDLLPAAKKVGILYNPSDAASQFGMKTIRKILPKYKFEFIEGSCNTPSDVAIVTNNIIDKVDVIYLSSDATVISGSPAAAKICMNKKKPLIVGDKGTVQKGGLATVSVGYGGIGTQTGILVDRLLKGEKDIPTVVTHGDEIVINKKAAQLMGVEISDQMLENAHTVFEEIK